MNSLPVLLFQIISSGESFVISVRHSEHGTGSTGSHRHTRTTAQRNEQTVAS